MPDDALACPYCHEEAGQTLLNFDIAVVAKKSKNGKKSERRAKRAPAIKDVYARFLLSPVLKSPVELEGDAPVRVGRSRKSDICFPSHHVSRLHTEIAPERGAFWVSDLGSKNGTFVNGDRVLKKELKDGDSIIVGQFELTYRELDKDETFELLRSRKEGGCDDTAPLRPEEGFYGDLTKLSASEAVQLVAQNRHSGMLVFEGRGSAALCCLFFDDGNVVHAEDGKGNGEEAALRLLRLRKGSFKFFPDETCEKRTIETNTQTLLLRALGG
jgi:pSer/pThr/pTyr-binding forkhead associated (FHA) protein